MGALINGIDEAVMLPWLDPAGREYPGFNPRRLTVDGLMIDYDVGIKLRDGVTIYADVYRPHGSSRADANANVRNATNKQYIAAVLGFDAIDYPHEVSGEPRTTGFAVKYNF
jgi:outer membrane receptor protein involved in Fe transport